MSTRDVLVGRCEARYHDNANTLVLATEWADYVNDAYMDVLLEGASWAPPAPFLEAQATNSITTSGTVTLPTDVWSVTAVYNDTDDIILVPLDGRSSYRSFYPDPASNLGTPVNYRLRANVLEVYPRPSATIDVIIDYIVAPAALGASDEPVFAEQYHRMLISGALAYAYEDDGNLQQADIHRARFNLILDRMKNDLLATRTEWYPGIQDYGI